MLKVKICLRISLLRGHYSSCLELCLRFFFFFSLWSFPLPFSIHDIHVQLLCLYHSCLPSACILFGASISEKRNTQTVYSFIHPFPAFSLFAKRAGSCLCLVTHHQILWGDYAEHLWFTHSWPCWRSVSWQHSPVNTKQVLSCWSRELGVISAFHGSGCASCSEQLQTGDEVTNSVSVLNRKISWRSRGAQVPAQQQPPPLPFTLKHALIFTFLNSKSCWDEHIKSDSILFTAFHFVILLPSYHMVASCPFISILAFSLAFLQDANLLRLLSLRSYQVFEIREISMNFKS